ncbi:MAG: hypothetical protein IJ731_01520, partial [Eubacterium sp.]|nr:hypothetical protein [Eubacterium sp.]
MDKSLLFLVSRFALRVARSRFLAALGNFFLSFALRVARCAFSVSRCARQFILSFALRVARFALRVLGFSLRSDIFF